MYKFTDEIHSFQSFVVSNFNLLGNYKIIKEQFSIGKYRLDILAYNYDKQSLAIVELKNPDINCNVVGQCIDYYEILKDKLIDGYDILEEPEIIIIAPEISSRIIVPENICIRIIKMNYDEIHDYVNIENVKPYKQKNSVMKKVIHVEQEQYDIPDKYKPNILKIINNVQKLYDEKLEIIISGLKISILLNKIIIKIILSKKWFDDTFEINIYKNFIKQYDRLSFQYDPNVIKINFYKTFVKLKVRGIPIFLLESMKEGNDE